MVKGFCSLGSYYTEGFNIGGINTNIGDDAHYRD